MDVKQKSYALVYVFIGFYCGFVLGAFLDRDVAAAIGKVLYASAILILGLYWRRLDSRAHQHNLEVWHELRTRGKWYFIVSRYVFLRGGLLLTVFGVPLFSVNNFPNTMGAMLSLITVVLAVMMVILGLTEWRYCEQDFQILALKRAAQEARLDAALHN